VTDRVDPERVELLTQRESAAFVDARPRSAKLWERAQRSLVYGVPMHWLSQWPLAFPH
jgi:glutamate-1-semialdehyde 2,1-aminomutase